MKFRRVFFNKKGKDMGKMISIGALMRWERLTGKPFGGFDMTDADDFLTLCYVAGGQDERGHTLATYKDIAEKQPKLLRNEMDALRRALGVMAQYAAADKGADAGGRKGGAPQPLAAVVYALAAAGADLEYVTERLPLWELPALAEAYDARERAMAEARRRDTWLAMIPHVKRGALRRASDLYALPWDGAAAERAKENIRKNEAAFREFMAGGGMPQGVEWRTHPAFARNKQDKEG